MGDRPEQRVLELLPEVFRRPPGGDFLARFLAPMQQLLDDLADEIELGLPELFDLRSTPPEVVARHHPEDGLADVTFRCLAFLAGWVGLALRPPPARSIEWNRQFLLRALPLLPLRGTLPGIDGLLRAWLADDLVDPGPPEAPILLVTDLSPHVNGGSSSFQVGETSTLGVDTVAGLGPDSYLVVDVVVRRDLPLLRHPVGVDSLRLAGLALLEAERPAHVHGELRIRGHTMQLAPPGGPATWGDDAPPYARLGEPRGDEPDGTALVWDDPWVSHFPDDTVRGSEW
jgi:hypothetical protein